MTGFLVVVALVGGVVLLVRRRRRKAGATVPRTFAIEPPTGRLGKRKRSML